MLAAQWEPESLLVGSAHANELLEQLRLHKADVARGGFGSVSIFENKNGEKLVGKFLHIKDDNSAEEIARVNKEFDQELEVFKIIYEAKSAGPHPNLVNVYGIANVPDTTGGLKRAILMDAVPGPTGLKTFEALRNSRDAGTISTSEYWGAIQFLGRRLLDVTEHISKAGVVHNDIKPQNFLVNEETGEPVLIDFGSWSKPNRLIERSFTWAYSAPEVRMGEEVNEKSDMFSVGASLLHGVEGGEIKELKDAPNQGLRYVGPTLPDISKADVAHNGIKLDDLFVDDTTESPVSSDLDPSGLGSSDLGSWSREDEGAVEHDSTSTSSSSAIKSDRNIDDESGLLTIGAAFLRELGAVGIQGKSDQDLRQEIGSLKDDEGNVVREPKTYSAKTAYTNFIDQVLHTDKSTRLTIEQAKDLAFLSDAMLDDDAAKRVIKKAISPTEKDEKNPAEKQWDSKQTKKEMKKLKMNPNWHTYVSVQDSIKDHPKLKKYVDENTVREQPKSQHKASDNRYKQVKKEMKELKANPNLHTYASLQNSIKAHPKLKKYMDENTVRDVKQKIEKAVVVDANLYVGKAEWFANIKSILEGVPTIPVKSGVKQNGVSRKTENEGVDLQYADVVNTAYTALAPHVDTEALQRYVNDTEKFLYEVKTLEIDNPEIKEKIKQVREHATAARRVLEIFELNSKMTKTQLRDPVWEPFTFDTEEEITRRPGKERKPKISPEK